ncbi:hypothetical protein BpHYR1_049593 [Brachionus plicatilis]|uniref:Uncharacterized protein n=1 Tax=Brachionus plicatilis TaxID=10195 RepID=A0A3M7PJU8_BRAPC|nr:hypothetical protein BpHYR1_049593 [Brachionus plicatilis]
MRSSSLRRSRESLSSVEVLLHRYGLQAHIAFNSHYVMDHFHHHQHRYPGMGESLDDALN